MYSSQTVPGKCHSVNDPSVIVNKGEILHLLTETHHQEYVSPTPEFKPPVEPQLFRLDETPYMSIVQDILGTIMRIRSVLCIYVLYTVMGILVRTLIVI